MPTGYTAVLYDGEQSFQDFLLRCARAFGYAIDQRDEDLSVAPRLREPNTYYQEALERAQERLAEAQSWTDEQAAAVAEEKYQDSLAEWNRSRSERDARKARYEHALEQARAWQPPSPEHENLKQYMIDQLVESIDHDCTSPYYDREPTPPLPGKEYREQEISHAEHQIRAYLEDIERDRENVAKSNAWITALYESLKEES